MLCVVFGVVLTMGQAVLARHRAAGAADLAALAAADHWMDGGTAACAEADRVARAQHARLVRCAVEGEISDVSAASGRGPFATEVRSRAGPAGPVVPGPAQDQPGDTGASAKGQPDGTGGSTEGWPDGTGTGTAAKGQPGGVEASAKGRPGGLGDLGG